MFSCTHCNYLTEYKRSMVRHLENIHIKPKTQKPRDTGPPTVSCTMCQYLSCTRTQMREHYSQVHDVNCSAQSLTFENTEAFEEWKSRIESEEISRFIKSTKARQSKTTIRQVYFCHRDGHFKSLGTGKRNLKRLGSNKINGCCPAEIKSFVNLASGAVSVQYIPTHVGHTNDLGRLPLPPSSRKEIARKLSEGVRSSKIISSIRDSVRDNPQDRQRLVTRQDVANVARTFKCKNRVVRHASDATSVDSWVAETRDSSNTVRFYKPRGTTLPDYPALTDDDFVLILANEYQVQMLESQGKNIICFDRVRGTGADDFELTTLLTVDETHKGFPCFFMVSNRSDTTIMALLALVVKDALGHEINTTTIMTDMSDIYSQGWSSVMPAPVHRLYCSWHVLNAWRENLAKITHPECREPVYKTLKALLEEVDKTVFSCSLQLAIYELKNDPVTVEFGQYFVQEFGNNVARWAYCHQLHLDVNTNMFLESMHKTLEYVYSGAKQQKPLDKAIPALMEFTRDKISKLWIALHRGGDTSKLIAIRKGHEHALTVSEFCVAPNNGNGWLVKSGDSDDFHVVTDCNESCNCALRCDDCQCCIHRYKCSCKDSATKWNMCEHIHLMNLQNSSTLLELDEGVLNEVIVNTLEVDSFEESLQSLDDLYHSIRSGLKTVSDIAFFKDHIEKYVFSIFEQQNASVLHFEQ